MAHRSSQRALFVDEPSSPPLSNDELFQGKIKRNIHSTPKHGDNTIEFGDLNFSAIYDGNMTITSGKQQQSSTSKKETIRIVRNRSIVNFGFVKINEVASMTYRFTNPSDEQLRFKISLESKSKFFKIVNPDVVVGSKEEGVITLEFHASETTGFYQNRLHMEKINGLYKKFTIKVMACSGCADVRVSDTHLEDGTMTYSQSGKIVFKPDFYPPPPSIVYPSCSMILVNHGQRSAFVCIQAVDSSDSTDNHVKIEPSACVVDKGAIKKFKISVHRHGSSVNCSTKLRVLWGEELGRIRFKAWQNRSMDKAKIYGEDFTKPFPNESKSVNKIEIVDQGYDEFKNSIRIFEISVVDPRLMSIYQI